MRDFTPPAVLHQTPLFIRHFSTSSPFQFCYTKRNKISVVGGPYEINRRNTEKIGRKLFDSLETFTHRIHHFPSNPIYNYKLDRSNSRLSAVGCHLLYHEDGIPLSVCKRWPHASQYSISFLYYRNISNSVRYHSCLHYTANYSYIKQAQRRN